MGVLYSFECSCGYSAVLNLGGGFSACCEDRLPLSFNEERLAPYQLAKEKGTLKGFIVENEAAYCGKCKELRPIPVLQIHLSSGTEKIFGSCGQCKSDRLTFSNNPNCPRCGKKTSKSEAGIWD